MGQAEDAATAYKQLTKNLGLPLANVKDNPKEVEKTINNIHSQIVTNLKTNKNPEETQKLISNILAYDKVLTQLGIGSSFIKGEDGLQYLDYRNPDSGVVVVYDPNKKIAYLKNLIDTSNSPVFNNILSKWIPSNKQGGKFADGGEIAEASSTLLKQTASTNEKAFNHKNATSGLSWNSQGSAMSNEDFNMEYEDYARIASLAANVGSIFAGVLPGAGLGVAASVGDLTADIADESISGWQAAKILQLIQVQMQSPLFQEWKA